MYIQQCVSLVILFWGEVGKFRPSWSSCMSGSARRNLSPTLGKLLRDGCACGARVKLGIRNVRRVHLTDIYLGTV